MTMNTITRGAALVASRLVAFVAGCIFVACAGAILFEDVALAGAPITLGHLLTAGVLSGTLLVGHLLIEAGRGRHYLAALGFAILFATGTVLIVYLSTGKQAEHTFQSQAEADFAADERARIKPLLIEAEAMLSGAAKAITQQCVEGKATKKQCDGLRATHGIYEGSVAGHKAKLEKLGAPKPVAPDAESFANIAAVFGFDKAKVKAGAILVVPFVRTILFELGGLWCLGFAFRPLPRSATRATIKESLIVAEQPRQPLTPAEQSDFGGDDIDAARKLGIGGAPGAGNSGNGGPKSTPKGGNGGGKRVLSKGEALLDLTRRLASRETVDAQEDLADAWASTPARQANG